MLLLFSATIFLSAFLLFQVQPMIGRFILPWFGSAPGVWATCMLFFQALLLLGYSYAHFVVSRWSPRRQAIVHGSLLVLTLLALPITPDAAWKPIDGDMPITRITVILLLSVGAPYLLLSSTGPLLQAWFARLSTASPYRLYALSNAGSLLALLSYPVLVEPTLALSSQTASWSVGFALFAILCGGCAWLLTQRAVDTPLNNIVTTEEEPAPGMADIVLWLVLATCGSALLLSTTNQLSLDVAVVPFLWILPLSLYLVSFIFCFDHDRWYVRPLFVGLLPLAVANSARLIEAGIHADIRDQVFGYAVALLIGCMCCHGEMARRRPAPRYLTLFFLVLAIGGALGGLLVAVVAPAVFSGFYEYPITLVATCAVVAVTVLRDGFLRHSLRESFLRRALRSAGWTVCAGVIAVGAALTLLPGEWIVDTVGGSTEEAFDAWLIRARIAAVVITVIAFGLAVVAVRRRNSALPAWGRVQASSWSGAAAFAALGIASLGATLAWLPEPEEQLHIARDRNFYGVLAIKNYDYGRYPRWGLKHGRIRHGIQLRDHPDWPAAYYGPASGVGQALQIHPARDIPGHGFRVGVVGLGAGALATYMNASADMSRRGEYVRVERREPPDTMRFYELNPMVLDWAEEKFSFLPDARRRGAIVETVLGDARVVLERELLEGKAQRFDVLVIDAFTGDAIPIHLLTHESLQIYLAHLAEGGILAMHVSNLYIDVKPVVHRLALELGLELVYSKNRDVERFAVDGTSWMLLTNNRDFLAQPSVHRYERIPPSPGPLWTDDYSSVFSLLRLDD
jgi:hypothetical protein